MKAPRSLVITLMSLLALAPVLAVVDDAHTTAMELAGGPYKKGFKIREDYWHGELKSGETKAIKAQLFKGNEYWFWLGCDEEDVVLTLDVFDAAGQKVNVEASSIDGAVGVRVVPPKTGTYVAICSLTHKKDKSRKLSWALAYGYR
jgi:hypothetical protein